MYNIVYGISLGPAVWLYVPEIIPAKIVPFATTLNWIGGAITILINPIVSAAAGGYTIFFIFGGVTLILFVINTLLIK